MAKVKNSIVLAWFILLSITVSAQCDISDSLKKQFVNELGIHELTGNNDGVRVQEYLKSTGLGKGYPWCAAFIYWNFVALGYELDIKWPAYAPSYFPKHRVIYTRGKGYKCPPKAGDIIGIYFQSKKRIAHVGFYLDQTDNYIITVEGNTNKKGSREGDGVLKKYRPKRSIYKISSFF